MKIYDKVKELLQKYPKLRDSDKALMVEIWESQGVMRKTLFGQKIMTAEAFVQKAVCPESIRRARQIIQNRFIELRGKTYGSGIRKKKEETKGAFIFQEEIK